MPKALTNAKIEELSLVFKTDPATGAEFTPMNPLARVLAVKSGEKKPSFLERVMKVIKGGEWPVSTDVADDVDHDGDGADDYNQIVSLLCGTYYDLQACFGIADEDTRSTAIKMALDGFKGDLDEIYSGKDEKAGARHSKADMETLKNLGDHLKNAADAHAKLMPAKDSQADKEDDAADKGDGEGEDDAAKAAVVDPAQTDAPEAGDTAKAAQTETLEVKLDAADIAGQIGSTLEAFAATFKADIAKQLEDHAVAVDGKIETILAPVTEELAEKTTQVSALKASVTAMETSLARKSTSPGGLPSFNGEEFKQNGFITETSEAVTIPANTPADEAVRMILRGAKVEVK